MDVTTIEQAIVELEPMALHADADDVRQAAGRAMAALVSYIATVSPEHEVMVDDEAESPVDSIFRPMRDKGDGFGPRPETQTPRPERAGRKADRGR